MPPDDPFEVLLGSVLQIMRDGYMPAPKLIQKLRWFNSEFASLCRLRGFSFDANGVLVMPEELPPCV